VEICFVPDGNYAGVLERELPIASPALAPGPLVTTAGDIVGTHSGFARFTIGQRRGLPGGAAAPRYVVAIRPETREVVLGGVDELDGNRVTIEDVNWLSNPLGVGDRCDIQLRYRSRAVPAELVAIDGSSLSFDLLEPARAIAPGQSGVMYGSSGQVLGGGVIA
jgi:tRNA-specific 2-thiouridylase